MKKYLITGFSGFVSRHFLDHLESKNEKSKVLGIDLEPSGWSCDGFQHVSCEFKKIDLIRKEEVERAVFGFQPDYILHLAALSSVGFSWKNPVLSFKNNTNIFLDLIDAVRELGLNCRILSVGSSEEYGNVTPEQLPLREDMPLTPVSPYAVARLSQEWLSKVYIEGYGLDIVMTRSFNHIGPGQREIFVISSFAKQIVDIRAGGTRRGKIRTGDLSIIRDFLDVRDVVKAYDLLFEKGEKGAVYNICSGTGISLKEIIDLMCQILDVTIDQETDPGLIRPNDNRVIIGSNEKLKKATGWEQRIPLRKSLEDIIQYWQQKI
ncbi:MAG TPA: GDP-mannose 4,6-dehydratase [Spirochaetota bacterium]|nr:GDP-mannose 4,6-dehydratase [Spirochaetota bacterium]HPR50106.1 GDP-mannose 4,6-dehydratase [Spirochaetota bacterium]